MEKKFKKEYESMERNHLIQASIQKAYTSGKNYFTKDAQLLYKYFTNTPKVMTEETSNMINRILYDMDTAANDVKTYEELVEDYIDKADVFLCGHIHANGDIPRINVSTANRDRISIIRKFAYDEWEDASEKKPHVRIMHPILENNGISIDIIQY